MVHPTGKLLEHVNSVAWRLPCGTMLDTIQFP